MNRLFKLFQDAFVRNIRQETQFDSEESKLFCQNFANKFFYVKEHDISSFFLNRVIFPQPLNLPCACGTFRDPVSSIGSVGSLVLLKFAFITLFL